MISTHATDFGISFNFEVVTSIATNAYVLKYVIINKTEEPWRQKDKERKGKRTTGRNEA